jgi:hypothetical protein
MKLQDKITLYLSSCLVGDGNMSDEVLDNLAQRVRSTMATQFNEGEREFKVSMSGIGKPLCIQQRAKAKDKKELDPPNLKTKFAYGYLTEALVMSIIEAAGIKVESFQEEVEVDLGGKQPIQGTLDVVIDGKVWDIKSTASRSFYSVYSKPDGFDKLAADDAFGYIPQGYLYAEGKGLPFGGWIALNKESGEIAVLEAPTGAKGEKYRLAALAEAKANQLALESDQPFERCYGPVQDTISGKPTGHKTLHLRCRYCPYKQVCWGDKIKFRARGVCKTSGKRASGYRWMFNG